MQGAKVDISVIIAMCNNEDTIVEAISSILAQDFKDIVVEVIVIDDASTDESLNIIEIQKFDSTVQIIPLSRNYGQANARNIGVGFATGRYLMILDADDLIIDGALLQLYTEIVNAPDVSLVFGGRIEFGPWGMEQRRKYSSRGHFKLSQEISTGRNPITHSGTIFRKDWFDNLGGYVLSNNHAEDLSLWFRGLSKGMYLELDIPTTYYRHKLLVRPFRYWNQMEYARRKAVGLEVPISYELGLKYLKYTKYWLQMKFRRFVNAT
jgi:glycosyltransferase involved in cell wall biosynthesis